MIKGLNLIALKRNFGIARYRADEHYHAALGAYGERDLKAAVRELESSIDLLPTYAEYHATLGLILLEGKDKSAAQAAFERALALYPYEMLANYGLGIIAYREKDWRRAAECFSNSLAAQPQRAETHYYLAMVNHRLGHNAQAMTWMQSAQARFASDNDRRESNCHAWLRQFERLT